ncbi:MAG TPA: acetylornithine transaminase [Candidatus Dormibacteraeota bacterium]|jgi:acetylornithine aminotransferase/acetylornithine/N-succinyldiaminopimelate aminotransferase
MTTPLNQQLVDDEHKYVMGTFKRLPVVFVEGHGMTVTDDQGKDYMDLVGGIAVNLLGHSHPAVAEAVARQSARLIHTSNLYYSEPQVALAKRLVELSFPSRAFFCNSGAEANEAAIKIAHKWGKKNKNGAFGIITAEKSFHGRTMGAIAATGQPKYQEAFKPLVPGFTHVPYGDLDAVKKATTDQTVAVMVEPILGEAGVIVPPDGYLGGLRAWCDESNLLLIVDEVQTGFGRTGRMFAYQHEGIVPDVMTLAKGLGGGVPIGACLAGPRADVFEPGDHGSTFGGNPLACTAALATIDVIESQHLVEHAAEVGELLHDSLGEVPGVSTVRGRGMMQAIVFAEPGAKDFQARCLEAGVVVNAVDDNTVRLVPPLIMSAAEVEQAVAVMKRVAT